MAEQDNTEQPSANAPETSAQKPDKQKGNRSKKRVYFSTQEFFEQAQHSIFNAKEDLEFMKVVDVALRNKGRNWTYSLGIAIVIIFIIALASSFFITRNEVSRAMGQVVPSKGVHPVQTEGGIIESILVKENDLVEKDQILGTISNVAAVSEYQTLMNRKIEYELRLLRLDAELNNTPFIAPAELETQNPKAVNDQRQIFYASRSEFHGKLYVLEKELKQRTIEVEEFQLRREQAEKTLLLLIQQQNRILPLVQSKSYSEVEYLGLKQRIVTMQGELNNLAGQIARASSAMEEAESKLNSLKTEKQSELLQERNKTRQALDSVEQELNIGAEAVRKTNITSHIRGTVKSIAVHPGSVVRPADLIMEIVPVEGGLEIVARFDPKDRGYLAIGQSALIKVSAFDFTTYGTLDAKVIGISADTLTDNRGGAWFEVRLRTTSESLFYNGEEFPIKVGMTVTVDVISGQRSLFAYLAKPLFKTLFESSAVGNLSAPESK